jgi:hypothetical protein
MLHDIGASAGHQPEPGALPLLSHALLETWKRRRGTLMHLRAYTEAGGVRGAIAHSADSVYNDELSPQQQAIARRIFLPDRAAEAFKYPPAHLHPANAPGPAGDATDQRSPGDWLARLITGRGTLVPMTDPQVARCGRWPQTVKDCACTTT